MQPQPVPGGLFGHVGDVHGDLQLTAAQANPQAGAIGERVLAVELQQHVLGTLLYHLPRLLPGTAMDRKRIVGAIGLQGQPAAGAVETAVGDPVRPGDQREAAELAGQTVFQRLRSGRA